MKLLLDTHAAIWFLFDNPQLSPVAREAIESAENQVFVSTVSAWEISIKLSIGKLTLPLAIDQIFPSQLILNNIELLSIELSDIFRVQSLAYHHRDPFDRMLIAQAIERGLTMVSRDRYSSAYGVPILW